MRTALQISDLKHRFIQAGKPLSLSAPWGSALLLHGKNGSGKSTLLNLIFKVSQKKEISRDFLPVQISYLPQQSLREFFIPLNLRDALSNDAAVEFLEGLNLENPWNESSGGEKQRVLLSLTCQPKYKVWVLDEPFNHLDSSGIQICKTAILHHCLSGGLVVISSHDPWQAPPHDVTIIQPLELLP